nr:MAG TPA: hypothetical protein [Caudoviricetes sp.]
MTILSCCLSVITAKSPALRLTVLSKCASNLFHS